MANTLRDIVERFEVINSVELDGTTVITRGVSVDGFRTTFFSSYTHIGVAETILKKVKYFVGI